MPATYPRPIARQYYEEFIRSTEENLPTEESLASIVDQFQAELADQRHFIGETSRLLAQAHEKILQLIAKIGQLGKTMPKDEEHTNQSQQSSLSMQSGDDFDGTTLVYQNDPAKCAAFSAIYKAAIAEIEKISHCPKVLNAMILCNTRTQFQTAPGVHEDEWSTDKDYLAIESPPCASGGTAADDAALDEPGKRQLDRSEESVLKLSGKRKIYKEANFASTKRNEPLPTKSKKEQSPVADKKAPPYLGTRLGVRKVQSSSSPQSRRLLMVTRKTIMVEKLSNGKSWSWPLFLSDSNHQKSFSR